MNKTEKPENLTKMNKTEIAKVVIKWEIGRRGIPTPEHFKDSIKIISEGTRISSEELRVFYIETLEEYNQENIEKLKTLKLDKVIIPKKIGF